MRKKRKFAIVGIFVVAAVITPTPDAVNQILMAGPLLILYEASIIVAKVFGKKKREDEKTEEEGEEEGEQKADT